MLESRASEVGGLGLIFWILALIFTALRVYVRLYLVKSWAADDLLLIAGLITFTAYGVGGLLGIKYGIGQHVAAIVTKNPTYLPKALMWWWLCEMFYAATTMFVRCSVSVLLLRLCERRIHAALIYTTISVVVVYSIFYILLSIFQCNLPSFFWEQYISGENGSCLDPDIFAKATYGNIAVSTAADWTLGLLPISLMWNVKMDIRSKVSVVVVLSLGFVAGIAAIARTPEVEALRVTDDFLWNMVRISNLSTTEAGLGLIATGACTLRPLFRKFFNLSAYISGAKKQYLQQPSNRRNSKPLTFRKSTNAIKNDNEINLELGATGMRTGGNANAAKDGSVIIENYLDKFNFTMRETPSEDSLGIERSIEGIWVDRTISIERTDKVGKRRKKERDSVILPWHSEP